MSLEELIYILPFAQYPVALTATSIALGFILLGLMFRLLKIPQKLMAVIICALAMMVYTFFQPDGEKRIEALQQLALHQKNITQRIEDEKIRIGNIALSSVKLRRHTMDVFFTLSQPQTFQDQAGLEQFAEQFATDYHTQLCGLYLFENEAAYRHRYQHYINMRLEHFSFTIQSEKLSATQQISLSSCHGQPS